MFEFEFPTGTGIAVAFNDEGVITLELFVDLRKLVALVLTERHRDVGGRVARVARLLGSETVFLEQVNQSTMRRAWRVLKLAVEPARNSPSFNGTEDAGGLLRGIDFTCVKPPKSGMLLRRSSMN
jgi:hypothetical protein